MQGRAAQAAGRRVVRGKEGRSSSSNVSFASIGAQHEDVVPHMVPGRGTYGTTFSSGIVATGRLYGMRLR